MNVSKWANCILTFVLSLIVMSEYFALGGWFCDSDNITA